MALNMESFGKSDGLYFFLDEDEAGLYTEEGELLYLYYILTNFASHSLVYHALCTSSVCVFVKKKL